MLQISHPVALSSSTLYSLNIANYLDSEDIDLVEKWIELDKIQVLT